MLPRFLKPFLYILLTIGSLSLEAKSLLCDLGYPLIKSRHLAKSLELTFKGNRIIAEVAGNEIALIEFFIKSDGVLSISDSWVEPKFRNNGIYAELLSRIIAKTKPRMIRSVLDEENAVAYTNAVLEGLSPEEAVKRTPAYRSVSKSGYTRIVGTSDNLGIASELPGLTSQSYPLRGILVSAPE